jgi:hypothetical protein
MFYIYSRHSDFDNEMPLHLGLANVTANLGLIVAGVFRCRDLGWSGWRVIVFAVPIANAILILILMLRRGSAASNNQLKPTTFGAQKSAASHRYRP